MAETNTTSYGKIGFSVLLGIACIVGTLIWIGGAGSGKNLLAAETYFNSPVSGLAVGSDVCFRGVKIGAVKRISFIANEYEECAPAHRRIIWVGLSIDPRLCGYDENDALVHRHVDDVLSKGLHATLSANMLTGIAHIELNYPKITVKDEPISWKPRSPCIPPAPTLLESAADSIPRILSKIEELNLVGGWSNVMEAASSAGILMGSANNMMEAQQGNISEILSNVRDASSALRDLSYQLRDNPSLILRNADRQPLPETK